ncbi:hypothetical protein [Endozoicomonas arenosclerae]|uniref:hypothetical protein n=1 Tax=Endozoicomonas arenosclerae TaxID=1633495 RepID=UPI000B06B1C4|nr:hypothetical protein [Endozoicomonas arenosclerae]
MRIFFNLKSTLVLLCLLACNFPAYSIPIPETDRHSIITEIETLKLILEQQKEVLNEQETVLSQLDKFYFDMPQYEPWDADLHQSPMNCSNPNNHPGNLAYKISSYTTLGLASIPAIIGPAVEAYRHHLTFNVEKKPVLWTAFTWPVASTFGNSFFDMHIFTNQEEDLLHKILNGIPTTMIILTSLYTVVSLIHYGRKYGLHSGW